MVFKLCLQKMGGEKKTAGAIVKTGGGKCTCSKNTGEVWERRPTLGLVGQVECG